jgi:ribosome modulation factor
MTYSMKAVEWNEGFKAGRAGFSHEENPYFNGGEQTAQSRLWSDGYWYARRDINGETEE